jgi:hypothetical protein
MVGQKFISDESCRRGIFPRANRFKRYRRVVYAYRWPPIDAELCHPGTARTARIIGHNLITKAIRTWKHGAIIGQYSIHRERAECHG